MNNPAAVDTTVEPSTALRGLLRRLRAENYWFVTPTPATHRRIVGRGDKAIAHDLRDAFGWSLPFAADLLPNDLFDSLRSGGFLESVEDGFRAKVRVSTLDDDLFLHAAFPPGDPDAVFFGPDTYRFARFLKAASDGRDVGVAIEVGTGSGAGAAVVARSFRPRRLIATDINPAALRLAAINLDEAGIAADLRLADGLSGMTEAVDLIVANPPFIAGDGARTYRDGGDLHGARLSLDWTLAGARRLAPSGRFLLYTGSAIVAGRDPLHDALQAQLDPAAFGLDYAEIDPDIFGGQLGAKAYHDVERIAAVGAIVTRRP